MKLFNRFLVLDMTLVMLLTSSMTLLANVTEEDNKMAALIKEYGLVDVDIHDVPEGVELIEINSTEELETILKEIKNAEIEYEVGVQLEPEDPDNRNLYYNGRSYVRARLSTTGNPWLELYCDFAYFSQGSFTGIEFPTNHGWDLYGNTINVSIGSESSSAYVSNGTLIVSGLATVDHYLLIDGGIKLATYRYEAGYRYNMHSGYSNDYINSRI